MQSLQEAEIPRFQDSAAGAVTAGDKEAGSLERLLRRSLESLQESGRLLYRATHQNPVAIALLDITKRGAPIIYCNAAFSRLSGYAEEEAIGRRSSLLNGPGTDTGQLAEIADAMLHHRPIETDIVSYRKNGRPFLNHLRLVPIFRDDGVCDVYLATQTDISSYRRKEVERVDRHRHHALSELSGGMAHEINNLLQPAMSLLPLVIEALGDASDDVKSDLGIVQDTLLQVRDLVRRMVAISKPASAPKPIDLGALVMDAIGYARRLMPPTVLFTFRNETGGTAWVKGTMVEMIQVLTNLTLNAVQAMQARGSITVTLYAPGADQASETSARLIFENSGPRIDPALRQDIFEPFITTKANRGGAGFGLPIAREIVRKWGGTLDLDADFEEGARFVMTMPLLPADAPAMEAKASDQRTD